MKDYQFNELILKRTDYFMANSRIIMKADKFIELIQGNRLFHGQRQIYTYKLFFSKSGERYSNFTKKTIMFNFYYSILFNFPKFDKNIFSSTLNQSTPNNSPNSLRSRLVYLSRERTWRWRSFCWAVLAHIPPPDPAPHSWEWLDTVTSPLSYGA